MMLGIISRSILGLNSSGRQSFKFIYYGTSATARKHSINQISYITSVIDSNNTEVNWGKIKNDVLTFEGNINEKNIDAVLLKHMVSNKKFDVARSFVYHLKSASNELPLGSINGLLSLYYELGKQNNLTKEEKQEILTTYNYLHEKYKVLDCLTCERLIHALCLINEWEIALKLLDDIFISSKPTHSAYSTIVATLFRNNKKKMAMKYIEQSVNNKRPLQDVAYVAWIEFILRKYKENDIIAKYLNEIGVHISKTCSTVSSMTAQRLIDEYTSIGWNAKFTKINKTSGQCVCCKQKLDCLNLSKEEFTVLEKNIKDKLIVGSDLFIKTSPGELSKFLNFIEKTGPYDIILDALNICYAVGKGSSPQRVTALDNVVEYFLKQNKKILVLGRKHMLNWQRDVMKKILTKTKSFFTDNISQDDPYFITAAILSGPHTDFVSKDLLRGHTFQLKDEHLRVLFKRWQWQHQWMVFQGYNNKFNIQAPLSFTPCAQKNNETWHLPYRSDEGTETGIFNDGTPNLTTWVCVSPKLIKINNLF